MSKRNYFLVIDTETTCEKRVADFAGVIVDRKGRVYAQLAVLLDIAPGDELFHHKKADGSVFAPDKLEGRYRAYQQMLTTGQRMRGTPASVNRWLADVAARFRPWLTAYNIGFDVEACENTGIILDAFPNRFCLMKNAQDMFGHSRAYRNFVLQEGYFNPRTGKGNWSYQTKAEPMARFFDPTLGREPHTAFEDIRDFELLILARVLKRARKLDDLRDAQGFTWRDVQVTDWFKAR